MSKVKFVIFLEANVDCSDLKDAVWRFTNNIDPRRDSFIVEQALDYKSSTTTEGISNIAFDGTRKTKEFDNFDRDWPNILAMDEKQYNWWMKMGAIRIRKIYSITIIEIQKTTLQRRSGSRIVGIET